MLYISRPTLLPTSVLPKVAGWDLKNVMVTHFRTVIAKQEVGYYHILTHCEAWGALRGVLRASHTPQRPAL